MNLERVKQAAQSNASEHAKWAVICTDGDVSYASTDTEARQKLERVMDEREVLNAGDQYDYAIVQIDRGGDSR